MKIIWRVVAVMLTITLVRAALAASAQPKAQPLKAGRWRWKVKTLQDKEARKVKGWRAPVALTVAEVNGFSPPRELTKHDGGARRGVGKEEFIVYRVRAQALEIKLEPDGDYHLVLQDLKTKDRLGVEIVKPEFATNSYKAKELGATRAAVEKALAISPATMSWEQYQRLKRQPVTVTGVGFWDMRAEGHFSPGSKSGFELHPVLSFSVD